MKLTRAEFDEILEVLADVLDHHPRLASTAAFALGKAYSDLAVPRLIAALRRNWQEDDELAYQLLIALDNYGLGRAWDLVRQVAKEGLKKSREFARDLVQLGTA
jgi:HEAT repeat protein